MQSDWSASDAITSRPHPSTTGWAECGAATPLLKADRVWWALRTSSPGVRRRIRLRGLSKIVAVGFVLAASFEAASSQTPQGSKSFPPIDIYFYGDTRQGTVAHGLTGHRLHDQILEELTSKPPSSQRAILFLGDAVSVGGSRKLFSDWFLTSVNEKNLCPSFCTAEKGLLFYPVIGDHETYLLPLTHEAADNQFEDAPSYETGSRYGFPQRPDRTGGPSGGPLYLNVDCPQLLQHPCNPAQRELCDRCEYQEKVRHGNLGTFVFDELFTVKNGFGPLHDRLVKGASRGATWYTVDFDAGVTADPDRKLVVMMLDTQCDARTGASQGDPTTGKALTQQNWIRSTIGALKPGTLLLLVGHQPPGISCHPRQLYYLALSEALKRGVRTIGVVASHIHDFGAGTFTVNLPDAPTEAAQQFMFVISGDAGAHDFESINARNPARPPALTKAPRCPRGWNIPPLRLTQVGGDWLSKADTTPRLTRDELFGTAWIGHLHLEGATFKFEPIIVGKARHAVPATLSVAVD